MVGARGGRGSARAGFGLALVVVAALFAACSASPAEQTDLPTFPTPAEEAEQSAGPGTDGKVIPVDCNQILPAADFEAVLGLPLGSVGLGTTIGIPQPSVQRTERVSCEYTGAGSGDRRRLLTVNATAYTDENAAIAQWRVNVDAETGDRRTVPLGSASAVLFERPREAVLMIAYRASNVTMVLPDQPLPGGRNRSDVLIDLALRVIPEVSVTPASSPAVQPARFRKVPGGQVGDLPA